MYWVRVEYGEVRSTVDMSPKPELVKHEDGRETIVRSDMQFVRTLLENSKGKTLLTRDCIKHWNTMLHWCGDNCIGPFGLHVAKDYQDVMRFHHQVWRHRMQEAWEGRASGQPQFGGHRTHGHRQGRHAGG
jgi:hypothetical protein